MKTFTVVNLNLSQELIDPRTELSVDERLEELVITSSTSTSATTTTSTTSSVPSSGLYQTKIDGLGEIIGHFDDDGYDVLIFDNIPFAKPPLGELRFAAPQAFVYPWDGVLNATGPVTWCLQESSSKVYPNFV